MWECGVFQMTSLPLDHCDSDVKTHQAECVERLIMTLGQGHYFSPLRSDAFADTHIAGM